MPRPEPDDALVDSLHIDLARPGNDHFFACELLPQVPLGWGPTGFSLPTDAAIEQSPDSSPEADEGLDAGGDQERGDDEMTLAKAPRRTGLLFSFMELERAGALPPW